MCHNRTPTWETVISQSSERRILPNYRSIRAERFMHVGRGAWREAVRFRFDGSWEEREGRLRAYAGSRVFLQAARSPTGFGVWSMGAAVAFSL